MSDWHVIWKNAQVKVGARLRLIAPPNLERKVAPTSKSHSILVVIEKQLEKQFFYIFHVVTPPPDEL